MIVVAPAVEGDIPELTALLGGLFAQEREFTPEPERQARGLALILAAPQTGRIFVAREGAGIAGMVSLLFTVSTALGAPVCWLEDMVVRPDARGRGVGGMLIEHAIAFARAEGYARLTLMTDGDNAAARRFYERHGFSRSDMVAMRFAIGRD